MAADESEGLARELNLGQASSVVVGIVIGSGIFVAAHRVAQGVDNVLMLLGVWVGAGLLTLLGALVYAEFGSLFPRSGGDYVYARESLGPFWGFFNGWTAFSINYPASLGALCLAWAMQLEQLKPFGHDVLLFPGFGVKFTALAILAVFVIINLFGVRPGGWAQFGVTAAKLLLILGLVAVGLSSGSGSGDNFTRPSAPGEIGLSLALVGALFAYDGWTGVTRVAGEVKEPQRNVPRALILGILGVIAIYVLLTVAYLYVLGLDGMRQEAVASRTAEAVFGGPGKTFVTVMILVSILGPINGLSLAGPRVYYAMARDRLFPAWFGAIHAVHRVPYRSIIFQGGLSGLLAILFSRDQLFSLVVLASWVSYGITGVAVIILRRRRPDLPRPYKVPGYPWVPGLLVLMSAALLVFLFVDPFLPKDGPVPTLAGIPSDAVFLFGSLLLMAGSVPLYRFFVRRSANA